MTLYKTLATSVVAVAAVFTSVANASYVDTFEGVTFTVDQTSAQQLTFRIQNAFSSTGTWKDATQLGAFSFKNLGLDFSSDSAVAWYLGASTPGVRDELSNSHSDVDCAAQINGETGSVCFDFMPDITPLTNDMFFTINFTGSPLNIGSTGPHLKIAFVDDNGGKVGSLYSQDIPSSSSGGSSSSGNVPEPNSGTLVLLGVALLGGSLWMRRRNNFPTC
jgi:hypothetical protein